MQGQVGANPAEELGCRNGVGLLKRQTRRASLCPPDQHSRVCVAEALARTFVDWLVQDGFASMLCCNEALYLCKKRTGLGAAVHVLTCLCDDLSLPI